MLRHRLLHAVDRRWADPSDAVVDEYLQLRLRYVKAMGWLPGIETDRDWYDDDAGTRYFVRMAEQATDEHLVISAGMRLTQVASLSESMTWGMLTLADEMRAAVSDGYPGLMESLDAVAADDAQGLWDLTRLVVPLDGSVPGTEALQSVYEVFGMALQSTMIEPGTDPVWVFLTTKKMKRLFDSSGIRFDTVVCGRVSPTDAEKCYLCIVRPRYSFGHMGDVGTLTQRRAAKYMRLGCDAVRRSLVSAAAV